MIAGIGFGESPRLEGQLNLCDFLVVLRSLLQLSGFGSIAHPTVRVLGQVMRHVLGRHSLALESISAGLMRLFLMLQVFPHHFQMISFRLVVRLDDARCRLVAG